MTFTPGDTFLLSYPKEKKHLHIIIAEILPQDICICAFVSSIVPGRGYDRSCELNTGDCSFISHPSYVVYDKMQLLKKDYLKQLQANGQLKIKEHLDDDVLQRVKDGALKSKMTPNNFRKHLEKQEPFPNAT